MGPQPLTHTRTQGVALDATPSPFVTPRGFPEHRTALGCFLFCGKTSCFFGLFLASVRGNSDIPVLYQAVSLGTEHVKLIAKANYTGQSVPYSRDKVTAAHSISLSLDG